MEASRRQPSKGDTSANAMMPSYEDLDLDNVIQLQLNNLFNTLLNLVMSLPVEERAQFQSNMTRGAFDEALLHSARMQ